MGEKMEGARETKGKKERRRREKSKEGGKDIRNE
jgi:hypothetical protein